MIINIALVLKTVNSKSKDLNQFMLDTIIKKDKKLNKNLHQ